MMSNQHTNHSCCFISLTPERQQGLIGHDIHLQAVEDRGVVMGHGSLFLSQPGPLGLDLSLQDVAALLQHRHARYRDAHQLPAVLRNPQQFFMTCLPSGQKDEDNQKKTKQRKFIYSKIALKLEILFYPPVFLQNRGQTRET